MVKELSKNEIIIATKNQGKANEFQSLLNELGFQIKTLLDFPEISEIEETGETFQENACLKAETLSNFFKMPVLSDDSGLVVEALGGKPGIYSARYAGEIKDEKLNNEKLLIEMSNVLDEKRTAKYVCVIALARPNQKTLISKGEVNGIILSEPRGNNGFGYDSLFFVPSENLTMAELPSQKKNSISHRHNALMSLKKELLNLS